MIMETGKLTIPSYPLVLTGDDIGYIKVFAKMYQLYHSLDRVVIVEHAYFKNYVISITEGTESITYNWLEFLLFEIVDLINVIHTETEGVYKRIVCAEDLFKKIDFEMLWENLEDWCADLILADFGELEEDSNVEYVFKMFKCTEHYITKNKKMVIHHKTSFNELRKDVDEYYSKFIGENPGVTIIKKEEEEINTGVIPGTIFPKLKLPMTTDRTVVVGDEPNDSIVPEVEDTPEDVKIKAELTDIKITTDGIYHGI